MYKHTFSILALVAVSGLPSLALAQHADIMVQDVDDRLTLGTADYDANNGVGAWILGNRTFADDFDSNFDINDPGWTIFGQGNNNLPPGSEGLKPETDLNFQFLPMKIDGYASNFMYWDGSGSVDFGPTPTANYVFGLERFYVAGPATIDGSPVLGAGETVFRTDEDGGFHQHRDWEMDDGVSGTSPVDGIYLVAMRNSMVTLDRSKPFYMIFGTPGSTTAARDAAEAWVDTVLDELAPDFSADFDGDLDVDSDDLAIWETGHGTAGSGALQIVGDANYDNIVDARDFLEWQRQAGSSIATFAGASSPIVPAINAVPEPTSLILLASAGFGLSTFRQRHRLA